MSGRTGVRVYRPNKLDDVRHSETGRGDNGFQYWQGGGSFARYAREVEDVGTEGCRYIGLFGRRTRSEQRIKRGIERKR